MNTLIDFRIYDNYVDLFIANNSPLRLHFDQNSGKEVFSRKIVGLIKHTGIIAGYDNEGKYWIIHNSPDYGKAVLTVMDYFSKGSPVDFTGKECIYSTQETILRGLQKVINAEPYSLPTHNCQHASGEICRNERKSEQLNNFLIGTGILLTLGLIYNSQQQ